MGFLFWGRKKKKETKEVEQVKKEEIAAEPEVKEEVPEKGTTEPKTERKNTTKKATTKEKTVAKKEVKEPKIEEQEAKPQRKAPASKVYHVSLRKDDGKWQVKYGGGKKAIKLFDTQAEAIKFAEERAESQDGSISIHKKDGKIRKQDYSKKSEEPKAENK